MLRMSKLTDYGTVVLAYLARGDQPLHSAAQVATDTRLAQPTVSKLLKALTRAGLVHSERGAQGGYALARAAADISAAEIIDALEGPVAITACSAHQGQCDLEPVCQVGAAWQHINLSIRKALREVTLDDLRTDGKPFRGLDLQADLRSDAAADARTP